MTDVWRSVGRPSTAAEPVIEAVEEALDAVEIDVGASENPDALQGTNAPQGSDATEAAPGAAGADRTSESATAANALVTNGAIAAHPADNDAGGPADAVAPLEQAVFAAAKTAVDEPAGDPRASAAVGLGWLMDAILAGRLNEPSTTAGLELPSESGYKTQAGELTALLAGVKVTAAEPATVCAKLDVGTAATSEAATWESALVTALYAAGATLPRAYGAGRLLSRLTHGGYSALNSAKPGPDDALDALDALATALPPHAARPVANSLRRWTALASAPTGADGLLLAQGELWRSVLAGDKKATEMLEPENYIDAAERLGTKVRATALAVLKRMWLLVLVIVALFAGGVALLVLEPHTAGTAVAGLSGVLSAAGLTWKGVGGTAGQLIAKLEAPVWGAEVDGAVTDAITLLQAPTTRPSVHARRSAAPSGDYAGRAARAASLAASTPMQTTPPSA